jgi:hypothetical protein
MLKSIEKMDFLTAVNDASNTKDKDLAGIWRAYNGHFKSLITAPLKA